MNAGAQETIILLKKFSHHFSPLPPPTIQEFRKYSIYKLFDPAQHILPLVTVYSFIFKPFSEFHYICTTFIVTS